MKKLFNTQILIFAFIACFISSCEKDPVPRNKKSIIPPTFNARTNEDLGTVFIQGRSIRIGVYDHGTIDGDIVSIFVNGKAVISQFKLEGPSKTKYVDVELEYNGYNYVLLYAHNEGTISPNTCTMTIYDGISEEEFELESDLLTNGAVNVVVE